MHPTAWTNLEGWVDAVIDGRFSEPVILFPWVSANNVYQPGEQGPDPSRKVLSTLAVFVTPGARLIGESGRSTGGQGGTFDTQVLEQEAWLSITSQSLGPVTNWQSGDRVFLPARDLWFNISYVDTNATLRPNVHLIHEHDITDGPNIPNGIITPTDTNQLYYNTINELFYRSTGLTNQDWVAI